MNDKTSLEKHTTLYIEDENDWAKIKARANLAHMKIKDYLWSAVKTYRPRNVQDGGLCRWLDQEEKTIVEPFDLKTWERYIDSKEKVKEVSKLIERLNSLTTKKRKEYSKRERR